MRPLILCEKVGIASRLAYVADDAALPVEKEAVTDLVFHLENLILQVDGLGLDALRLQVWEVLRLASLVRD